MAPLFRQFFIGTLTFVIAGVVPLLAQHNIEPLLESANQAETAYRTVLQEQNRMERQSAELNKRIDVMKRNIADSGGSPWQRMQLERRLQEALTLGDQLQQQNRQVKKVQEEFQHNVSDVLDTYNQMITGATLEWKALERRDAGERLRKLIEDRDLWRGKMPVHGFGNLVILNVVLQDTDGPVETREKADLLRDMSDNLKQEVQRLDERKKDFLDELKLRNEIAEFLEEVAVFEPRDHSSLTTADGLSKSSAFADGGKSIEAFEQDILFRLMDNHELVQEMGLSSEHIPALVQRYDSLIHNLQQQAAEMFYRSEQLYDKATVMEDHTSWDQ